MTGLPRASLPHLPQPSTLAAERPSVRARYTPVGGGGDNDRLRLAVILALACLGLVLCCVAAAALVVCRRTLRGRAEDAGRDGPPPPSRGLLSVLYSAAGAGFSPVVGVPPPLSPRAEPPGVTGRGGACASPLRGGGSG